VSTQLDIWNRSLAYLDLAQTVKSLTEGTPQAGACSQFWDAARKFVLERCYWSNATKAVALSLLLDQSQLTSTAAIIFPGWRYIYARPTDCLKAQCVTTQFGIRANPWMSYWWQISNVAYGAPLWGPFRPPWTEILDQINQPAGNSIDILTDQDGAWLIYTTDIPNVAIMPESLADAIAWQLAVFISGPVSANQRAKTNAIKMAPEALSTALAQNLNEQQPDAYPESPSIQARL
jgi:hypothetical protein